MSETCTGVRSCDGQLLVRDKNDRDTGVATASTGQGRASTSVRLPVPDLRYKNPGESGILHPGRFRRP